MISKIERVTDTVPIPFLRWAGGKRWLISSHVEIFPKSINRYFEPFLGSGAVYFGLAFDNALLSDINGELIETYQALRNDWPKVEKYLHVHAKMHSHEYYYTVRASNPSIAEARAARFIYLNRTCFNGIYRVNRAGGFNVPKGTRDSVILDGDDFSKISNKLQKAELVVSDFAAVISQAMEGDFIFVDPPYTVAHNQNGFIKYNEKLFTWDDQIRLRNCLSDAARRGVDFILTNADHPSIRELYRTGFHISQVARRSSIASGSAFRCSITELIVRPDFK